MLDTVVEEKHIIPYDVLAKRLVGTQSEELERALHRFEFKREEVMDASRLGDPLLVLTKVDDFDISNYLKFNWKITENDFVPVISMIGQYIGGTSRYIHRGTVKEYGLYLETTRRRGDVGYSNVFQRKYYDAPFNFCLVYKEKLIASLGFAPGESQMIVKQIQGVYGQRRKLQPFRWEKALLQYAVKWAQQYNIPEIIVVSAQNNKYNNTHTVIFEEKRLIRNRILGVVPFDPHRSKMLYDITAQRCGFKLGTDGNYHKILR